MPVQDDAREREMRQLFNLQIAPDRRRSDVDAYLDFGGVRLEFELKSTTSKSVSTVRDFGLDHVEKWRNKHWLFGFYAKGGDVLLHCQYASPAQMDPWIAEKAAYVRPDQMLADIAPSAITAAAVHQLLGEQESYSLKDARSIMKMQWSAQEYRQQQDLPDGYSTDRMTEILKLRCRYVILRGSTLNNPHISGTHFATFPKITQDHAATLRRMVAEYLATLDAQTLAAQADIAEGTDGSLSSP